MSRNFKYLLITCFVFMVSCEGGEESPPMSVADSIKTPADSIEGTARDETALPQEIEIPKKQYSERQGAEVYDKYCVICHGAEGRGDGFNAWNLDPKPRDLTDSLYMSVLSDDRLIETVTEGGRGVNKSILMPAWGNTLRPVDIRRVVSFVRTFSKTGQKAATLGTHGRSPGGASGSN